MLWIILMSLMLWTANAWALPAFPGAVGFGAETIGGRGGAVIEVTTLNDTGAGSFRAALAVAGPKIIVFRTSGTIDLKSNLKVTTPFVTIAGQSAPSPGITLKGYELTILTHDVVVQHVRVRLGDQGKENDGIEVLTGGFGEVYNVVVDHCSASWAIDENISVYGATTRDVTISNSIIAEGLRNSIHADGAHSMGGHVKYSDRVSYIGNVFAHNNNRNPQVGEITGGKGAVFANNVVYNWGIQGSLVNNLGSNKKASIIGSVFKTGTNSDLARAIFIQSSKGGSQVYLNDNMRNEVVPADPWAIAMMSGLSIRSDTPPIEVPNFTARPVTEVQAFALATAGARPTDRDTVDKRILADVANGTGQLIDSQTQVGGWPELAVNEAPPDSDHDGMPNEWESANGLKPADGSDGRQDKDGDGYTNVEEYLHSLFPVGGARGNPPAAALEAQGTQTVTVTWAYPDATEKAGEATGARVERSTDGGEFVAACTATAPVSMCSDTPQDVGHTYTYQLILTNEFGDGPATPLP